MTRHEIALSDTRDGLKRLQALLTEANEHMPGDDVVAEVLVRAARREVECLLAESRV